MNLETEFLKMTPQEFERVTTMTDRWEAAVNKLVGMTEDGLLRWAPNDLLRHLRPDMALIGDAYVATVNGKQVAIYEYRYKYFRDAKHRVWETGLRIEFITPNLEREWTWPATHSRFLLLETIRYGGSQANQFLERFLTQ